MAEVININDVYHWHITRIAEAFKLSRDTVRKRLKEANLSPVGKRGSSLLYRLDEVGPALFIGDGHKTTTRYQPDELTPKDRKEWYQSENERLKCEEKTNQLIPVDEVRSDLVKIMKINIAFFESLPDKMERTRLFEPVQLDELERVTDLFREQLYKDLIDVADE